MEVTAVLGLLTFAGWFTPFRERYHAFGHIYLLAVVVLSTRVGRWPVFFAAVLSAIAWNYVYIPPQLSFSVIELEDALILGTYFTVAIIAGQLAAQVRAQERLQREREQRATALVHLTRALTGAETLHAALDQALRNTVDLFEAKATLLLVSNSGTLDVHPPGTLELGAREIALAKETRSVAQPLGRFTWTHGQEPCVYVPLLRNQEVLGVFVFRFPSDAKITDQDMAELIEPFVAQVALLAEREQLRAASEREKILAESERLHRTLLDSVSHELKTPLAVLVSASEEQLKDDASRREPIAQEIRTATRRLERLVGNLLSQSRLESGALKPKVDWCDGRDLISAARRHTGDALAGRNLIVEIPEDLPIFPADSVLMEQAIENLLLNAAVHTPAGTPIMLRAATTGDGKYIRIVVEDNGPGIPEDLFESLFKKFQRGPHGHAGGVGLGLSIVRGFVEAQGGFVTAANLKHGGAQFSLYLPVTDHEKVPVE